MEDFWSQNVILIVLSLVYSIVLTWFIGLLPVILVRYFLVRRPLSKKSSKLLVCVFWTINLIIFTFLGSKNRTHAALYIVGLVSYFIYRTDKSLKALLSDIFFVICFWKSLNHLSLFLWLRYLHKKKIVFLSIAAVALSVLLLIVVSSLFTGFINSLRQAAVETIGDVVLAPPTKFAKYKSFIERLQQTASVEAATATLSAQGLLHLGKGNVRAVNIWGIEPNRRAKVTSFKRSLLRQKDLPQEPSFQVPNFPEKIGGFVGIGVVGQPDEETDEYNFDAIEKMIGQHVVLTTGTTQQHDNATPKVKREVVEFSIADIVFTGVYDFDKSFVYLPIEELQKVLYPDEGAHVADQIQIKLNPGAQPEEAIAQIRGLWQNFAAEQFNWPPYPINWTTITTAQQMQSQYIAELKKQMGILLLIFGIVSFSVILLIFCIFYMIVVTRRRDIAIIKSCGTTSSSVSLIFVGFSGCIGVIGASVGAILGYVVTKNINTIEEWVRIIFGLKLWKSSVYMFSKIPDEVDWNWALSIALLAVVAAVIGALIPAIVAAKTKPVEILRYE
jgi:lipoprotein-releasing system permease protein